MTQSQKYKKFLRYFARPSEDREYSSLTDMLTAYGITAEEAREFKQKDTFEDDLYKETMSWARSQTPDLLHVLYKNLKTKRSSSDIEKWMRIVHEQKQENNTQVNVFNFNDNLTDKQREYILNSIEVKALPEHE